MSDLQARLIECFSAVFPKLKGEELLHSSVDSVADWDSLASVTLYSIIETAKANRLEPYQYLRGFFQKLPLA